jgi:hypothetical protein
MVTVACAWNCFSPEPLNLMFCDESEYSLAAAVDSGDENVMEGGLTIRQHQQGSSSGRLPRVSWSNSSINVRPKLASVKYVTRGLSIHLSIVNVHHAEVRLKLLVQSRCSF